METTVRKAARNWNDGSLDDVCWHGGSNFARRRHAEGIIVVPTNRRLSYQVIGKRLVCGAYIARSLDALLSRISALNPDSIAERNKI
jgi:hypothetical protein